MPVSPPPRHRMCRSIDWRYIINDTMQIVDSNAEILKWKF